MHVQLTLTQTHTLMLFTEQVAPGDLSSKYGSQTENSPPPLLFSHPSLSEPEKARNVRAAQFNPVQSEITYLSSSTYLLLFFSVNIFPFSVSVAECCYGNSIVMVSSTCDLIGCEAKPQVKTSNHKSWSGVSKQCWDTDLIVFMTSESAEHSSSTASGGVCFLVWAHVLVYMLLHLL